MKTYENGAIVISAFEKGSVDLFLMQEKFSLININMC